MAFVTERIESLEQLELLVLLMESPDRWFDAAAVADTLMIKNDAARHALDRLASRNLLAIRITGDVRYQFQPGDEDLRRTARDFGEVWRTNRLGILRLVARSAPSSVRDFANAFRIRRHDNS